MQLTKYTIYFLSLGFIGLWFAAPMDSDANSMGAQSVAPSLTRVEPDNDVVTGETTVQIIGENFQDGATVTVGGNGASNIIFVSPTELIVTVPAGTAGSVDVIVTNPDGKSGTLEDGFTYIEMPQFSPYDVTQDGVVNILDLVHIANQFGKTGEGLSGDVNGDGVINILDLVVAANHFSE